jgi:hypothetical protein
MNCLHCSALTTNGLALCDLCRRKAETCLTYLPVYFGNLARWRRPSRPNGSLGTSGQWLIQRGESESAHIAVALERTSNDLSTWARALADDRGIDLPDADTEATVVVELCALLTAHLTSVATLEWAGQFVRDMDRHERILSALTACYVPGWYAGACRRKVSMEDVCGAPTYVVPGLTWVTCAACNATTYARDHLDAVLDEAQDWIDRPMRLAEAVVALLDTEMSIPRLHKRISKWGERERIVAVDRLGYPREMGYAGEQYLPKRYRLGDVIDALLTDGATRLDGIEDVQAC